MASDTQRFGPPFVIQAREDGLPLRDGQVLSLTNGPNVVALVHIKHLEGKYFEVSEVRPVLHEEQDRPSLELFRELLKPERF